MKPTEWNDIIVPFLQSDKGLALKRFVEEQRSFTTIYPDKKDMMRIFKEETCPYSKVKVVIVGQDPYYNGTADGLAFSSRSTTTPDSLRNVFKELKGNLYSYMSEPTWKDFMPSNTLDNWAKQGILLMNTVMTVEKDKPNSHQGKGWEELTSMVIERLGAEERPLAFVLWGSNARKLKPLIKGKHHLILESVHPSPLSAEKGFFGCKHFSQVHEFFRACDYYTDSLKNYPIDMRPYVKMDEIIKTIKDTIGTGHLPVEDARNRIERVREILSDDFFFPITYMFDFSTKPVNNK